MIDNPLPVYNEENRNSNAESFNERASSMERSSALKVENHYHIDYNNSDSNNNNNNNNTNNNNNNNSNNNTTTKNNKRSIRIQSFTEKTAESSGLTLGLILKEYCEYQVIIIILIIIIIIVIYIYLILIIPEL